MLQDDLTNAREHLVSALEADLIGPYELTKGGPDSSEELLRLPPSRWYLTGFLAPMEAREVDEPTDDELAAGPDHDDPDGSSPDAGPKRQHFLPASMGLSVLLPPALGDGAEDTIRATVLWAEYRVEEQKAERSEDGKDVVLRFWRRNPREPVSVDVPLEARILSRGIEVPGAPGVWLMGKLTSTHARGLKAGTRALALFVVNRRGAGEKGRHDEQFMFQVRLELEYERGFERRPNWRGEDAGHRDERIADLQFRQKGEWAVGHNVSAQVVDGGKLKTDPVRRVTTAWIPRTEVRRVKQATVGGLEIRMKVLASLDEPEAVRSALRTLPVAYGDWIEEQTRIDPGSDNRRRTRDDLLADAQRAQERIAEGIELLAVDPEVRLAFRLMNEAMASQALRARPDQEPRWRLFQLAFILLSLPSVADARHPDRELVELIYFPTGGGKTEAYLGVIAIVLLLRRMRGRERPDGGDGVAVILRYTLRLLTLDQLARASTLICALELLRRRRPQDLGETRFAIGLWVGRTATANTLKEVAKQITAYKDSRGKAMTSPFPLTTCPWCGQELARDGLRLEPDRVSPQEVQVFCLNDDCAFHVDESPEGLPVHFVDEQIYRELPAFLVATVDKFAMLPWRGETGMLFGRVSARVGRRFYGPVDGRFPREARRLSQGLTPPELIVQDELHLISGPLGTMVGLYETAIEALSQVEEDGSILRPKVLAATATVRQATEQIRALFGRTRPPAVFPPPGIDDGETFFATVDHKSPGRLYIGLAAPGRAMKALLLRSYVALLTAAQWLWAARSPGEEEGLRESTADGYMTLVGYFNSLRELGGMRRLVEDEVVTRCRNQTERRPEGEAPGRWFRDRRLASEPVELTSREPTGRIAETKERLSRPHGEKHRVDTLLASNMISVGIDIPRLALMVVAGQPKTTAEYIQASSRVGRRPEVAPGLVVTCFNVHKPRDRSHYEHFSAYHESFYRDVEASSLTPFSAPALDRGLAGTLVALTRLADPVLTPNGAAADLESHAELGEAAVRILVDRARRHRSLDDAVLGRLASDLEQTGKALLDSWQTVVREAREGAGGRRYSPYDLDRQGGRPLLFTALDENAPPPHTDDSRFEAPTSMRDVEASVHVWLQRQPLGGRNP